MIDFQRKKTRYLNKHGESGVWSLQPPPTNMELQFLVVIPACDEILELPATLESLEPALRDRDYRALAVVVVNHPPDASAERKARNRRMLAQIPHRVGQLPISVVDAASPGLEFPQKSAGVGLARKVGTELSLGLCAPDTLICHLDADTRVAPNYFDALLSAYADPDLHALVVDFCHRVADPTLEQAIRTYEQFLRTTANRLAECGSPYAYPAVGSTMSCRASAYVAVAGMPRRQGGEDFYFLQKLAKYRGVRFLRDTRVFPAARLSDRVFLGTGQRLEQSRQGQDLAKLFYSEQAFETLAEWLALGQRAFRIPLSDLQQAITSIDGRLLPLLQQLGLQRVWPGLQGSAHNEQRFRMQFHRWFDALKTMQLLKGLSDRSPITTRSSAPAAAPPEQSRDH